jgi:alpha-beta hydrolase superfamily lysophospholipase
MRMKSARSLTLATLLASAATTATADSDLTLPAVPLRAGITADIHVRVYEGGPSCSGGVVLAVHGFAHTAASWKPFADVLLGQGLAGQPVCKVAAVDLPGRGGSGLPTGGLQFGIQTLADEVAVVRAALERLPALGLAPDTVLAHSQGGLLVQLTQKALLSDGSSLRHLGIAHVVLLSSVGPREIPWEFVDNGTAVRLLVRFFRVSPLLGPHVFVPDARWPSIFFTDLLGGIAGAPAPADVARYNAREPAVAGLQLLGLGFRRPSIRAGAFAPEHGSALTLVTMENDTIVRPAETTLLYEHLTGTPAGFAVIVVGGPTSVHDMHVADPAALAAAIASAGDGARR